MNEIQLFKNDRFGEVRVAGTSEEPLFCLADVCKAIGIANPRNVKDRLDGDDVRQVDTIDNLGRTQQVNYVTESGMYDVIIRSDSENAIVNGITSYAGRAKAQVVGKMKTIISADSSTGASEEEIDKFGAAYESGVNAKIGALVKQHFVLVRDLGNGTKEFNVFMSIDESAAKKAREEAAQEAKKQAALGNLSQQVEEFIGEPVEAEE